MSNNPEFDPSILRSIRGVLRSVDDGTTDAELMDRFVSGRDHAAFELMAWRHMGTVQRTCRSVLRDYHLAEDVSQAVFLALARCAPSIRNRGAVIGWLHQTAYRLSLRAAGRQRKRRTVTTTAFADVPTANQTHDPDFPEAIVNDAIMRLPDRYRLPVLLCYFESLSHTEAAKRLKLPVGSVKTRITRAKELLGRELNRRGVTLSAAGLVSLLSTKAADAASPALVRSTIRAAIAYAARESSIPGVSPLTLELAQGALRTMFISKLRWMAGMAALGCTVAFGAAATIENYAVRDTSESGTAAKHDSAPKAIPQLSILAPIAEKNEKEKGSLDRVKAEKYAQILTEESMRKEIGCTEDQSSKITEAADELTPKAKPGVVMRGGPAAIGVIGMRRPPTPEAIAEFQKKVVKVLNPDQLKRLKQIGLQTEGPGVILNIKIGIHLKLTEDQAESLEELIASKQKTPATEESTKELSDEVVKVLKPEQREKWADMIGKPISYNDLALAKKSMGGTGSVPMNRVMGVPGGLRPLPGGRPVMPPVPPVPPPGGAKEEDDE